MTSKLLQTRLDEHRLAPLLEMRARGTVPRADEYLALLDRADILVLGAAADLARRHECGDEVRIHVPFPPPAGDLVLAIGRDMAARGTALLRHIATRRLLGPIAQRIVVDFGVLGLEIAQVALSFGATDLAGAIASRRGLPMLEGDDAKKILKRREIAALIERAGFRPLFVDERGAPIRSDLEPRATGAHVDS